MRVSREEIEGKGRRERMRRLVMRGLRRHCVRISVPMKPDVPVKMYFIILCPRWWGNFELEMRFGDCKYVCMYK